MVKKKECYTKKTKTGANYTTCVEGQKKPKKKRRTKAQMAAARAMAAEDKPAPKVKRKPKPVKKKNIDASAGGRVLLGGGGNVMRLIGSFRKGMKKIYTAQQIKDIVDNNILKIYTKKVFAYDGNLEEILQDSMVTEAENSYWGTQGFDDADDEKISTKSGRMDWYDAMAIPSMKVGNEFKEMYPLLIGWMSMDKYKNDNDVITTMAKLIKNLLTDTGDTDITYTNPMLQKLNLMMKDNPFYYPQSKDRRIGSDKWRSFMEGQYTRYVKKIKIPKTQLALGRLFRGIVEGHKFNIRGPNVDKLVKINLSNEWNSKMLVYPRRIVKGKLVMGLGKDAVKLENLTDYLGMIYEKIRK